MSTDRKEFHFSVYRFFFTVSISVFAATLLMAQPTCAVLLPTPLPGNCNSTAAALNPSIYLMATSANIDFTFDNMAKYLGGITQNGATVLKLVVNTNPAGVAACRWNLEVHMQTFGATPANELELLTSYGPNVLTHAPLNLLQIRTRNECNTPVLSGFQNIANTGLNIPIINLIGSTNAGCMVNVNGPGSFLVNYSEYHFTMDYRIQPPATYQPGIYQVLIHYCLFEQN
jgi:hypothetical protein